MRKQPCLLYKITALALALCLLPGVLPPAWADTSLGEGARRGTVRVYLSSLGQPGRVDVAICGSYSLDGTGATALPEGQTVSVGFSSATGQLTLTAGGVTRGMGTDFRLRRHEREGQNGVKIKQARVSGNLYPGDLQFKTQRSGGVYRLYVIAHVFIEDYLLGVLPYEMGNASALEALKAQCVCARTYTLRAMNGAGSRSYDLVDTTNDQVYNGTPSGNARCRQAVEETRGIVSMSGDVPTATYYTASNGGQIESTRNIWGYGGQDYIRVKDDPFDLQNPAAPVRSFRVSSGGSQTAALNALMTAKARQVFGASEAVITAVTAVTPHTPRYAAPSRLYTKLSFQVTARCDGVEKQGTLTFDIFSELEKRLGMSINADNNELWTVLRTDTGFTVQARRFGHGTGMSQRGAMRMGDLGYTYDQILDFYFEGSRQAHCAFVRSILSPLGSGLSQERLSADTPAALTPVNPALGIVQMNAPAARMALRQTADPRGAVIAGIPHGAAVTVHRQLNDWYLITYGALTGYAQVEGIALQGVPDGQSPAVTVPAAYGTAQGSGYLNLREGASLASAARTQIPAGAALPLLRLEEGWAYTQYGSQTGYVNLDYLAMAQAYPGSAADANATGAVVTGEVPLYLSASFSGVEWTRIPAGAVLRVCYDDGAWSQVEYQGVTGYVPSAFLQSNGQVIPAVAQTPGSGERWAQAVPTGTALNLRREAGMESEILLSIPRGESLIVTGTGDSWLPVRYHGVTGFCSAQYIKLDAAPAATPVPAASPMPEITGPDRTAAPWQPVPVQVTVTYAQVSTPEGSLNMRRRAASSAPVLARIPRDTLVEVLSAGEKWTKVDYKGKTGYVMTAFLNFVEVTEPVIDRAMTARVATPGGSLNLRAKAASGSKVLRTVPQDSLVVVLEYGEKWSRVAYGAAEGYVRSQFLQFDQPPEGKNALRPVRLRTGGVGVVLLASPDLRGAVLAVLPAGDYALLRGLDGDWGQVEYEGLAGYVPAACLEMEPWS